jgi:hypothetical protein
MAALHMRQLLVSMGSICSAAAVPSLLISCTISSLLHPGQQGAKQSAR